MLKYSILFITIGYVTWSREMTYMSKMSNFEFLAPLSDNLNMLHLNANPEEMDVWLQS